MPIMKGRVCLMRFLLTPAIVLALTLSSCSPKESVKEATPADTAAATLPQSTSTDTIPQISPTPPTATKVVATAQSGADGKDGLVVLSMKAGGFRQLFAYHPVSLPLSLITTDEWNHDNPAISPDGTKLAYCADEFGRWDIFILDLLTGKKNRLTETSSYACSPSWSPDGRWLVYEEVVEEKLDLVIRSVVDQSTAPVRLTNNGANNFSPAWSPEGREIAFVTDRNGRLEIWLADLDAPEQRFRPVVRSANADYSSPAWSQTGDALVWTKTDEFEEIETWNSDAVESKPVTLGSGSRPVWMDNPKGVLAVVRSANGNELVAYSSDPTQLLLPPLHLPGEVFALTWVSGAGVELLKKNATDLGGTQSQALWQTEINTQDTSSGRYEMIYLSGVTAPEPYLIDTVNESFESMREDLYSELGWDFLKTLENASLSIPANASVCLREDWEYTGRAIAINLDPLDSGWMVVNREDILGRTYWRLWLKCMQQDGSCGVPILDPIWDFNARVTGDAAAYENGGKNSVIPQGYWIDFTSFARGYGWERLPAGLNWRGYFPETHINQFVLKDGLDWFGAMRERYAIETIREYWSCP